MEQKVNHCETCKYFVKHYAKDKSGHYYRVLGCGHCINLKLPFNTSHKIFKKFLPCEHHEPMQKQIEARKQGIVDTLYTLSKHIKEIALILKDDEKIQ